MLSKAILLSYFSKLTSKRLHQLATVISPDELWEAPARTLRALDWRDDTIAEFFAWKQTIDERGVAARLRTSEIMCITRADPEYPPLLTQVHDPPLCLFIRGCLRTDLPLLAVVGSRKHSPYGKLAAEHLTGALARHGLSIVSGLAYGIDSIAHEATLAEGGYTIAVLGGGVDDPTIQPARHLRLAHRIIASGGAVISEYPPGLAPQAFTFPARNRIIAGMTRGTLVVEAADTSGALITAQYALENNRDVFAVPQNIFSQTAAGVNRLLTQGATLVAHARDILTALNIPYAEHDAAPPPTGTPAERALLAILTTAPVHINELAKQSGLPSREVASTLTLLELRGAVKHVGGMHYAIMRD